tara:strand:+ start:4286 stop:5905 length:1620 start_codon:yes stop_codon:yes gene_type:complete
METACIYARYSSDKQSDGFSIEGQLHACTEFAERNGYKIVNKYIDEAKSGTSDKRKSFQCMLDDARSLEKPFDFILVYNYERFSRSRQDQVNYKHELKFLGIHVVSITQPIDHESPDSVLLESLYEGMAEQYSRKLARDVKRGMVESAKRGFWTGGNAPLGYKRVEAENGKKKIVPCEITAPIVKKIFEIYASEKHGFKNIVKIINDKYPDIDQTLTPQRISDILKNKRYIGSMVWGERQDQRKRYWSSKDNVIEVKGCHPPIIAKKTFTKVQKILVGRKTHTLKKYSTHLLSGIIRCGNCGASVVGCPAKGRKYLYYTCSNKRKSNKCNMRSVNASKIEPKVISYLQKNVFKKNYLDRAVNKMVRNQKSKNKDIKGTIDRHQKKLSNFEKKKSKLLVLVEETDCDMGDIASRIKELNAHIAESKGRIEIEEEKLKVSNIFNKIVDKDTIDIFQQTASNLLEKSISNEVIKKFIRTITLNEENIEIEFYLSEDLNDLGSNVRKGSVVVGRASPFTNFSLDKNPFFKVYNNLDLKQKVKV